MEISKAEMASAATAANSAASSSSPVDLRGGEILVKALQAENVKYIWGYPGGAVLHIYDAFFKQDTIQHVLVRHEQAAVHAADGYARASGKPDGTAINENSHLLLRCDPSSLSGSGTALRL